MKIRPVRAISRKGQVIEQWIVGFVDGEGCFSISVVRNPGCRLGWQVQHEFSVTQASELTGVLELLIEEFGCGV